MLFCFFTEAVEAKSIKRANIQHSKHEIKRFFVKKEMIFYLTYSSIRNFQVYLWCWLSEILFNGLPCLSHSLTKFDVFVVVRIRRE